MAFSKIKLSKLEENKFVYMCVYVLDVNRVSK